MTDHVRSQLEAAQSRLWRFCLSLTNNQASAEDLLQSTCVRILERAHQFRPGTRFESWMFRIAQSIWINELRRANVRKEQSLSLVEYSELADSADPEADALKRQIIETVLNLPEAQRVTILLVYVEGFTYAEAAEILEIPTGTVMSRIAAGRRSLARSRLGQSGDDHERGSAAKAGPGEFDRELRAVTQ